MGTYDLLGAWLSAQVRKSAALNELEVLRMWLHDVSPYD
jgi:hypothetical protein